MQSFILKHFTVDIAKRLAHQNLTGEDIAILLEVVSELDHAISSVLEIADSIHSDEPWTGDVAQAMFKHCATSRAKTEELVGLVEYYDGLDS